VYWSHTLLLYLDLSVPFFPSSVCFLKLGTLVFTVTIFTIVIFSSGIAPFLKNMQWLSLCFLTNFGLKSAFRYKYNYSCKLSGSICLEYYFNPSTFNFCISFPVKLVSQRQQMYGSL
jgi:hypothetical protein